jgi:uncharacterized membrane protein YcaP (DUF421 family)
VAEVPDTIVIQDGRLIERNLERERMTPEDVAEELRTQQIGSFDEVAWAILEPNGAMSFIKKR